jgi:hypothetical protein
VGSLKPSSPWTDAQIKITRFYLSSRYEMNPILSVLKNVAPNGKTGQYSVQAPPNCLCLVKSLTDCVGFISNGDFSVKEI